MGEMDRARLQKVSCPILYLAGTEDDFMPGAHQLFEWRPENSCLVEINGADHFLFAVDLCSSPVLAGSQPTSCTEWAFATADKTNALIAEFIEAMADRTDLPDLESLRGFDPKFFVSVQ